MKKNSVNPSQITRNEHMLQSYYKWVLTWRTQHSVSSQYPCSSSISDIPAEDASVPTHVLDINDLDRFPDHDETVKMSERAVNDAASLSPNVQSAGIGISIGTLSRQGVKNLYELLYLRQVRIPGENDVEIRWLVIFQESSCARYLIFI